MRIFSIFFCLNLCLLSLLFAASSATATPSLIALITGYRPASPVLTVEDREKIIFYVSRSDQNTVLACGAYAIGQGLSSGPSLVMLSNSVAYIGDTPIAQDLRFFRQYESPTQLTENTAISCLDTGLAWDDRYQRMKPRIESVN